MVIVEDVMVIVVFVMVIVGGCSAVVIVRVYSEVMTGPHTLDNSLICRDMTEGLRQTLTDSAIVDTQDYTHPTTLPHLIRIHRIIHIIHNRIRIHMLEKGPMAGGIYIIKLYLYWAGAAINYIKGKK